MTKNKRLTGYPSVDKPWLDFYTEEEIAKLLPDSTMYDCVYERNRDNLDKVALNYYGTKISYRSFFEIIDQIASSLEQIGIKEGDAVSICMFNPPEAIYLIFALNKIGAIANMVYGMASPQEIRQNINDADSTVVFTLDTFQDKILSLLKDTKVRMVITSNMMQSMSWGNRLGARLIKHLKAFPCPKDKHFLTWKAFIQKGNGKSSHKHNPEMPAIITYTGGTTGGSKGVLLSNRAVLAVAEQYIIGEKALSRNSTWAQVLPLFIAYGVTCSLMIPLMIGMTLIVRINMADTIAELYKKFKPNHIIYGPAFWEAFADDNQKLDLSGLIAPVCGGDVLHPNAEEKINNYFERCGCPYMLMNGYGMTEVGAAVSCNNKLAYEFGSVGIPFVKNVISAFDIENGKELRYNETGEICIHTPSMMDGYIKNLEETEKIIRRHEDGLLWVHTGDLGYVTENGFIHINGRLKRYMLRISIETGLQKKLFSLDVEKVFLMHPWVENCAVVPIPDTMQNQVPKIYIILKKEADKSRAREVFTQFAEKNMDEICRPVEYVFVKKFPLTKIGKVDYQTLERGYKE